MLADSPCDELRRDEQGCEISAGAAGSPLLCEDTAKSHFTRGSAADATTLRSGVSAAVRSAVQAEVACPALPGCGRAQSTPEGSVESATGRTNQGPGSRQPGEEPIRTSQHWGGHSAGLERPGMISHSADVAAHPRQPRADVSPPPPRPVKAGQAVPTDDLRASMRLGRGSDARARSFAEYGNLSPDVSTGSPVMSLWRSMDPNGSLNARLDGQGEGSVGRYSGLRDSVASPALVPKRPSSARPLLSSAHVRTRSSSSSLRIKVPADLEVDTSAATPDSPSSLGAAQTHMQDAMAPPHAGGAQCMLPDRSPPGNSARRGQASSAALPARPTKRGVSQPLSAYSARSRSPSVSPTAHPLGASGASSAGQSPLACTASDHSKDSDSSPLARSPEMTSAGSSSAELLSRSGSAHSNTSGSIQKSPARDEKLATRTALSRTLRSFHEIPSSDGADQQFQGGAALDRSVLQARLPGYEPYQPSVRDIGTTSDSGGGTLRGQQRPHDLNIKGAHRPSQSLTGLALVDRDSLSSGFGSPSGANSDTIGGRTGMRAVLAKWQKYQSLMESSSSRSGSPSSCGSDASPRLPHSRVPRSLGSAQSQRVDLPTSLLSLCKYSESALDEFREDELERRSNASDCSDAPEQQRVKAGLLFTESDTGGDSNDGAGEIVGVPGVPGKGRDGGEEENWQERDSAAIAARAARLFRERARQSFKRRMARARAAGPESALQGEDVRPLSPSNAEPPVSTEQLSGAVAVMVSKALNKDSAVAAAGQLMDAWRSLEASQGPGSPHTSLHRRKPSTADEAGSSGREGQGHESGSANVDSESHMQAPIDTTHPMSKTSVVKDYSSAKLYKNVIGQASGEKQHNSEGRDRGGGAKDKDSAMAGYAVKRAEDLEKVLRLPSHKGTMTGRVAGAGLRRSVVPISADGTSPLESLHADRLGRFKANSDRRGRGDWPHSKPQGSRKDELRERVRAAAIQAERPMARPNVDKEAAGQRAKQLAAAREASRVVWKGDAIAAHSDRGRQRTRVDMTPDNQLREIRALLRPLCNSLSHSAHILGKPYKDIHASFAFHRRELGAGRFGVIRKCKELATGKVYACKSISKSEVTCIEDAEDVRTEIACLTMLRDCPSVVNIKGTYEDPESVHIIMELCQGGDLCDRIAEKGCLSEGDAARLIAALVMALNKCHSLGIMHRDVKPENVLLVSKESDCVMKLVDFGVSCLFEPGKKLDAVAGTVEFMAPEVLNESYGPEADIWSAGVLLHIALSGMQPFWASSRDGLIKCIHDKEISFRSARWAKVSEGGKDIIEKMLQKNPLKRISGQEILRHPWVITHTRPQQ